MDKRHVLITGVSRGLGLALVEQFVEQGHIVTGCSRSAEAINDLNARFGEAHQFDVVDVCNDSQVAAWAKVVLTKRRAPDLLINNAGIINSNASLWEIGAEEFSRVMNVNVLGTFQVIRHFVPAMIERGSGIIVNMSSAWGRSTSPHVGPYCTSKWAVEGLTRALADELPYGLAAIPLNPGVIHTEMLESCFGDSARNYPSPREWARRTVPFLLELAPEDNGDPLTAPI
jgi:NAD(P)-dependent dehydrogenase (short-subunit alcohol dehydrogenase family)